MATGSILFAQGLLGVLGKMTGYTVEGEGG